MGACCSKRDKDNFSSLIDSKTDINEIQQSLAYIQKYFDSNRDSQIIVLCYSKNQINNYINSLLQVITIIKEKTGQLFVPTVLQNNPLNPTSEIIIYMRSIENLDKFEIDSQVILDEKLLAKSFCIRQLQFLTNDLNERKNQLSNDLKNLFKNEGLMIVGGFQDINKQNSLCLLFYKRMNFDDNIYQTKNYEINIDVRSYLTSEKDFEICINQAQLDQNFQIRSVITFEDTTSRNHFLIYQENENDKLYMIQNFPDKLNLSQERLNGVKIPQANQEFDERSEELNQKLNFAGNLSKFLNREEKRMGVQIIETIVNTNLYDSYIIQSS